MTPAGESSVPFPNPHRLSDRVLARFTENPPGGRLAAWVTTILATFLIGWMDYLTGPRMSFVIFYLVPVALAVAWLGRTNGTLLAGVSVAIRFIADSYGDPTAFQEAWLWWNSIGMLLVYLVVVWVLDALIRLHRQLKMRVRERTEDFEREVRKRQEVQRELLELSTSERSAMGRELHDQLGQHLVGTAMAAQVLAHRLSLRDEAAAREARHIANLVEQGIGETRQLARGLLLTHIEPARLGVEIEELCAGLRQQFPQTVCELRWEETLPVADAGVAAQVFRIVQEGLRNALRHSGGTQVRVECRADDAALHLTIEDNGRGLPPEGERGLGMGLGIMRHRADHIGARLEISSRPGGGTRITCDLPLHGHPSHEP